nr:hypothetical protein [Tanacetum cinerariifolium]
CNYHHTGQCAPKCNNCKKYGYATRDCRVNLNNNNNRVQNTGTCFKCGEPWNFKKNYLNFKNNGNANGNGGAQGKAYVLGGGDSDLKSNTVTGTFLLNNRYALILFNTSADRSFTLDEAIELANDLMDQKLYTYVERQNDNKRKADDSIRNNQQQQPHKKQNIARAYTDGPGEKKAYTGNLPLCTKCNYHHTGQCAPKCNNCKKYGYATRDCRVNLNNNNNRVQNTGTCFKCGEPWNFKKNYLNFKNNGNANGNGGAQGKAYVLGGGDSDLKSNTVTGTFLLNNRYALILFNTSADRSFVSTTFSALLNIAPTALDNHYDVKLIDGKIIRVNTIFRGCTLDFLNHPFNIDLILVPLGSFDVIIGMELLREYHAVIICDEKIVRVSFGNETLIFQGKRNDQEAKDKLEGKRLEDVPIVRDFPEVFPKPRVSI